MQSSSPGILSAAFRNPTIMAMVGSAGIHGLLVLTSALKPAESLPTPLRIVSIAPGGTAAGQPNGGLQPNGLPVPNGLPPINLGDVPELSTLPNLTQLGKLASQSIYLGSNPSPVDFGKLSIKNPPQRSVAPNLPSRTFGIPHNLLGPYPPNFNGKNFVDSNPSGKKPLNPPPGYPQVNPNPSLTRVFPGVEVPSNGTPSPSSTPTAPGERSREISPQERGSIKTWAIAKGQQLGQDISIQSGPSLTATYSAAAGASGTQESSARVAVLYGPDGSVKDIQTVQSADNLLMSAAAIDAAKAHSVQPTGAYQIVTYEVRLRPDAALNKIEPPKPTLMPTPSPESSPSVSPKSSPTPSAAPPSNSSQKEPSAAEPKPSPTASNGPLIAPATPLSKDEILRRLTPKSSKAPEPSPSDTPTAPNTPAPSNDPAPNTPSPTESSSSMEPVPTPSIAAPQSTTPASP